MVSRFSVSGAARATTVALALCASGAGPLGGQDSPRFSVHGYLTQGWGKSNGTQFYGLTDEASTDFRYAALQLRYFATPNDQFVVQVNHRRLGQSKITDFESDVNLNWAFYQHAFNQGTSVKIGRMPIPRGIYNELRNVGVVLPMYRPPVVFYDEGAYYSETIDGVIASHTFFDSSPWSLEMNGYLGGWRSLAYDTWSEEYAVYRVRARNAIGGQLWLNTPADGVRFGLAAQRHNDRWEMEDYYEEDELKEYHLSLDATRERWFVRAEGQLQHYVDSDKLYVGYVQANYKLTPKLGITGEMQRSRDTDVIYGEGALPPSFEWHRSDGVGVSYAFTPSLVLKVEQHWDRGIQIEQPADPLSAPRFRYVIASLSASF
jgi:hypothetical protein